MMIFDRKNAVQTIMSKRHPDTGEKVESSMKNEIVKDEGGNIDGRHLAAQDMMNAIHEKSPEKLMQAMANFHDLHSSRRDESDSGDAET